VNIEKVGYDVDEEKQNVNYLFLSMHIKNKLIKNNAIIVIATIAECCLLEKVTTLIECEYLD